MLRVSSKDDLLRSQKVKVRVKALLIDSKQERYITDPYERPLAKRTGTALDGAVFGAVSRMTGTAAMHLSLSHVAWPWPWP